MIDLAVIDVGPVSEFGVEVDRNEAAVAEAVDQACRDTGFFLIAGHGVDREMLDRLDEAARRFFALPDARKAEISMARGGRAWRGWFPEGDELTAGRPDRKEGIYFGPEHGPDHPEVRAGTALHGPNLFPDDDVPELRPAVLAWIESMTRLGHRLARAVSLGLGLPADHLRRQLTTDPTVLFRIFRYPPLTGTDDGWGVAEHTDYGLLTILAHDGRPGLEVRSRRGWIPVRPTPGAFVVNIGDMLDRMTGGRYRSTPHRVRHSLDTSDGRDRLSFPFFFDPSWTTQVAPLALPGPPPPDDAAERWDRESVHGFGGTYGQYLTSRVARVFPGLGLEVLGPDGEQAGGTP